MFLFNYLLIVMVANLSILVQTSHTRVPQGHYMIFLVFSFKEANAPAYLYNFLLLIQSMYISSSVKPLQNEMDLTLEFSVPLHTIRQSSNKLVEW